MLRWPRLAICLGLVSLVTSCGERAVAISEDWSITDEQVVLRATAAELVQRNAAAQSAMRTAARNAVDATVRDLLTKGDPPPSPSTIRDQIVGKNSLHVTLHLRSDGVAMIDLRSTRELEADAIQTIRGTWESRDGGVWLSKFGRDYEHLYLPASFRRVGDELIGTMRESGEAVRFMKVK
jgi:hypothetical protein